jgi:hypothetical protein
MSIWREMLEEITEVLLKIDPDSHYADGLALSAL